MPVNFSNKLLGLNHGPAWPRAVRLDSALPPLAMRIPVPQAINWHKAMGLDPSNPDALGNLYYGCCVPAGYWRLAQMREANAMGSSWRPVTAQVLASYSAWTNPPFDLATGENDNGTDVATAQQIAWAQGMQLGPQNEDVPIPVTLDHTNLDQLRRAAWMLGGVGFSLALPTAWQTTPVWSADSGPPASWGYHFVPSGRFSTTLWYVISWGLEIPLMQSAIPQYCVGAVAVVSRRWVEAKGLTPTGLTWDMLESVRSTMNQTSS